MVSGGSPLESEKHDVAHGVEHRGGRDGPGLFPEPSEDQRRDKNGGVPDIQADDEVEDHEDQ